LSYGRQ